MHLLTVLLLLACAGVRAATLDFDAQSVKLDGKRQFLVSGEFHYFRVPSNEWRRRLELLKDAGGNCVATYVPWCIHEPEEGNILFGDRPERDLAAFLRTVREVGLVAIVRPGPYQYSELVYDGLPRWLIEGHPEIATKRNGKPLRAGSVDYNHPVFLEKARPWFKAVAEVLRPHMAQSGGPVAMVQLDNELTGIHLWFGATPTQAYFEDCANYLVTLRNWLAEDGIPGPYCHNAGSPAMTTYFAPAVRKLGTRDFLLGYDNYYTLGQNSAQENPTPAYFMRALLACDTLRSFGYPPVGFEIQGGTIADFPPILANDLLACHMCNLAAGMRGVNYYIFTGGPNFPGSGNSVDIYDYHAPVAADGSLRETYGALQKFGAFVREHRELLEAERIASVQLGYEWQVRSVRAKTISANDNFFTRGMLYSLMFSPYAPEHRLLDFGFDAKKPIVLAGIGAMSAETQRKVADFVAAGGGLLVAPDFPRRDLDGKPCTVLADAVGAPKVTADHVDINRHPVCIAGQTRLYYVQPEYRIDAPPSGARRTLASEDDRATYGCSWAYGKGRVSLFGATWTARFFSEADALAELLAELGAQRAAVSSNRNVLVTSYRLKDGRTGVFALNLHASPQKTTVTLPGGASRDFDLAAMEVGYAVLDGK